MHQAKPSPNLHIMLHLPSQIMFPTLPPIAPHSVDVALFVFSILTSLISSPSIWSNTSRTGPHTNHDAYGETLKIGKTGNCQRCWKLASQDKLFIESSSSSLMAGKNMGIMTDQTFPCLVFIGLGRLSSLAFFSLQ